MAKFLMDAGADVSLGMPGQTAIDHAQNPVSKDKDSQAMLALVVDRLTPLQPPTAQPRDSDSARDLDSVVDDHDHDLGSEISKVNDIPENPEAEDEENTLVPFFVISIGVVFAVVVLGVAMVLARRKTPLLCANKDTQDDLSPGKEDLGPSPRLHYHHHHVISLDDFQLTDRHIGLPTSRSSTTIGGGAGLYDPRSCHEIMNRQKHAPSLASLAESIRRTTLDLSDCLMSDHDHHHGKEDDTGSDFSSDLQFGLDYQAHGSFPSIGDSTDAAYLDGIYGDTP